MKNILLVIDNLGSGGAQNQITLLARGLAEKGHSITLVTYYPQDFFKERTIHSNIKHISLSKKTKLGIDIVRDIKSTIDNEKIEVVISFLDTPNFYAAVARKLSKTKPKLIVSYRSKTTFTKLAKLNFLQKRWVNKQADVIIANSIHERNTWVEKYPSLKSKFKTIYNCVDQSEFKPQWKERKREYLVVGSVGPAKNGLVIIDALRRLKSNKIDIDLKWVGRHDTNIERRRNYLDEMNRKINEWDLKKSWEWIEPVHNISDYYNTYRGLILASEIEGLPNVVCEAMSCGMPVILSNVLDHHLLVEDNITGYLFNPIDSKSLSKCVLNLENLSKKEYKGMSQLSYEKSISLFTQETYLNEFEEII